MTIFPPKKHSPKDAMTDFTPCPKTIRLCLEALPIIPDGSHLDCLDYYGQVVDALGALLPDPAEDLARDWREQDTWAGEFDTPLRRETAERFARWLINQGKVRP